MAEPIPLPVPERSPEPRVRITRHFRAPFASILTSARTCYSAKLIEDEHLKPGNELLARDLYEAGHHTTIQHAYFQFSLENVSRQFLWSFLHAHPFYNSEQVSQRYVKVRKQNCFVPPIEGEALAVYQEGLDEQLAFYREMIASLTPLATRAYDTRFPARANKRERYGKEIEKKAQEIARYVLPVATCAFLYHTVSALTILRYWRMCEQYDAPYEQRLIAGKMVQAILEVDADYKRLLDEPVPAADTPEARFFEARPELATSSTRAAFVREFDASLEGKTSKLMDWKARGEEEVARAVREVLGLPSSALSDDEAIRLAVSPASNPILGQALNLSTMDKLTRAMHHPAYTFRKKLSHAGDSQDQRHRMTPASRPILAAHQTGEPDYVTPTLVKQDGDVHRRYDAMMTRIWERIGHLKGMGVSDEFANYLLPNAVAVRFTESTDYLNLRHKHVMRLCYNAQEEIWQASVDEALQVREVHPRLGEWLLPPCTIRKAAGTKPFCPEGNRFCGLPIWKEKVEDYRRVI
jgi:thymidylate synthase ThyX